MLPLLSNRDCLDLGPHHHNPWLSVKVATDKDRGCLPAMGAPARGGCPHPGNAWEPVSMARAGLLVRDLTHRPISIEKWASKTLTLEGGEAVHPCLRSRIWQCIQSSIWLQ
ncbi:hypothetical protein ACQJBY_058470 [Aegilops geniculata]